MTNTISVAESYYKALGQKNLEEVEKYLHPDIHFEDPQEEKIGKKAVLEAAKRFTGIFKTLTIRSKFGSQDQAVIIYDTEIPGFDDLLRAASLLSFKEGLISKIELIYDMSRFQKHN